jgi:hypothetical protein
VIVAEQFLRLNRLGPMESEGYRVSKIEQHIA